MTRVTVVQGQQVKFPQQPSGKLVSTVFDLIRCEDQSVATWQVNLSPIFRSGVGPTIFGQPGRQATIPATGSIVVVMTWGGGGVKFTTQFPYPVNGASFAVAGDNVQVQVVATDTTTVFPAIDVPAVEGWASKRSAPTSQEPLAIAAPGAAATPMFIDPWTRALHVGATDPTALITVQFNCAVSGAVIFAFPAGTRIERLPIPNDAVSYQWTATAGLATIVEELAFT